MGVNVKIHHRDSQKALHCAKTRRLMYRSWKSVNRGDL